MKNLTRKDYLEDLKSITNENDEFILFDQIDKPFLLVYLIIFVLGIFLTIVSI